MSENAGFPFHTSLRLDGLIDYWVERSGDPRPTISEPATAVLRAVAAAPDLRGPIKDPAGLERHRGAVDALVSAFFPPEGEFFGSAGEPFRFRSIYETPEATDLGIFSEEVLFHGTLYDAELIRRGMIISAYELVLARIYGREISFNYPVVVSTTDPQSGLPRHFQLSWNSRFVQVVPRGAVPRPTAEELDRLVAEPTNVQMWLDLLPPDRFELSGLAVTIGADVTQREAVSRLKDDLLQPDAMATPARLDQIATRIRTLLGRPDLRVGVIGFDRGSGIDAIDHAFSVGRSLLLSDGAAPACPFRKQSYYASVFERGEPTVVGNLDGADQCTGFEYHLMSQGLKSLLVQPLSVDDRLVGLLEIGSPQSGALTAFSAFRLTDIVTPFATALKRTLDEREDRLQAVIKQRYTAIHPAVEWRFREAAIHLVGAGDAEAQSADEIVFDDVFPLYGLTDIRSSSETRNRAIQSDLLEQLRLAQAVIRQPVDRAAYPVLDQMAFRLGGFISSVEAGLQSENESVALAFLRNELEPLMDRLAGWDEATEEKVTAYRAALDETLGVLYRRRRAYEDGVARFNETVSQTIDREQRVAQAAFPHFFEKFQTDGVDYNIYIGESIAENGDFSRLYLQNLRLWQLQLVSRIQWDLQAVSGELGAVLEPTHLILVQDQPLSIRFRTAEKRFDVDGAYNIRYELVKKRIDKARIRGTTERITQPGSLALVYAHGAEAREYRRYLEFLIATGFYTGEIENHELEDMQGVSGLKAFRVEIHPEPPRSAREGRARAADPGLLQPTEG